MTRSPLAYPLNRSADMDAGGAADLQTDIMRFMAILSLCLVAIFALVQSIPLTPAEPLAPAPAEQADVVASTVAADEDAATTVEPAPPAAVPQSAASQADTGIDAAVVLTRPKWQPRFAPEEAPVPAQTPLPSVRPEVSQDKASTSAEQPAPPVEDDAVPSTTDGFTLRFESDAALTRLVATNSVGVYALADGRAQRMAVSESRISFWEASTPNSYHEMETETVPGAVIDALSRNGTASNAVSWAVTLPGKLKSQLEQLMLEHRGGSLIIGAGGDIRWENS